MQVSQKKLELIKKIAHAHLTPSEVEAITAKAVEIINRHKPLKPKNEVKTK